MSYDPELLFEKISAHLRKTPCRTLCSLSRSLHISRQTLEKAVYASTRGTFGHLRDQILLALVRDYFVSAPNMAIKEVAFALGFASASSFARTIKRLCGCSPEGFRSRITHRASSGCTNDSSSDNFPGSHHGFKPKE
jgi:AraC family transcriptional regulator